MITSLPAIFVSTTVSIQTFRMCLLKLGTDKDDAGNKQSGARTRTRFPGSNVPSAHNALPTLPPLLSVTPTGLTAVGGMALAGGGLLPTGPAEALAGAAVLTSAINIGGGFTITQVRAGVDRGCLGGACSM